MFSKRESVHCPVCKQDGGYLGQRGMGEYFDGHCGAENPLNVAPCQATYYFSPGKKVPYKVMTDKQEKNICKCPTCVGKIL